VEAKFNYNQPIIVVGCVIEENGKYLLVRESRGPAEGLWNFPSGTLDVGETLIDGAARETLEESGYSVEIEHLLGVYQPKRDGVGFVFLFVGKNTKISEKYSHDISEVRWFTGEEIGEMDGLTLRSRRWKNAIQDYEEGKLYSLDILKEIR